MDCLEPYQEQMAKPLCQKKLRDHVRKEVHHENVLFVEALEMIIPDCLCNQANYIGVLSVIAKFVKMDLLQLTGSFKCWGNK